MNTAKYIPYDSVAPIIIFDREQKLPYFSGTGFFVKFEPYDFTFFITARHCIASEDNSIIGSVFVHEDLHNQSGKSILFEEYIMGRYINAEYEDVAICVVDKNNNNYEMIHNKALKLIHQDEIKKIFSFATADPKFKLRTVGYPATEEKYIDYEQNRAFFRPRGFYGDSICYEHNMYCMKNLNWKDNEGQLSGFSGSPMIELIPHLWGVAVIPVGIITNGGNGKVWFVSINIATEFIAKYISDRI